MDAVIQIIQSLGFPVACTVCMFMMWQREVKSHDEEMEKMRATLADQTVTMTDALNNNTVALTRILDKIGANDE